MALFTKESLETLRGRVDVVDVLSSHIDLKRTGSCYRALCPFHDEKTPSFLIQKGESHYHCFGCGAHGDAIQFLMQYLKLSFSDAVEHLAQRFNVQLEQIESAREWKGPSKALLKEALEHACRFYQFILLHTSEGHEALNYLYKRGLDLEFIRHFQIGLAPSSHTVFLKAMENFKVSEEVLQAAGLLSAGRDGGLRPFFSERITFPIRDTQGLVIGFSARKYKESTFGGKYINTAETLLFKKSKVLFGLNYSRRRIAKERRAIIVEGQIDALRLIYAGLNTTVAGQGTAFGEGHVRELVNLGVSEVFLAFDADEAGRKAACKVGHLFQREGIEVSVVRMPYGKDPDAILTESGPEGFLKLLEESVDYLTFLVEVSSKEVNADSPAGKHQLIQLIAAQIQEWDNPLMVHESLRKVAHLLHVPEEMVATGMPIGRATYIKRSDSTGAVSVDPDRVLEADLLRWLLLIGDSDLKVVEISKANLRPEHFRVPVCRQLYQAYLEAFEKKLPHDLLSLAIRLDDPEGQDFFSELTTKKINLDRAEVHFKETVQQLLTRHWMEKGEEIRLKIQSNQADDEILALVKQYDGHRRNPIIMKESL